MSAKLNWGGAGRNDLPVIAQPAASEENKPIALSLLSRWKYVENLLLDLNGKQSCERPGADLPRSRVKDIEQKRVIRSSLVHALVELPGICCSDTLALCRRALFRATMIGDWDILYAKGTSKN